MLDEIQPSGSSTNLSTKRPLPTGDASAASPFADVPIVTRATYHRPHPADTYTAVAHPRHRLTRHDGVIAAALFAIALLARAPFILKGETLLHSDEAIVGLMAQDIAAGRQWPVYFYGQRYMGSLEAYVIAALSPLLENPIHALRAGPACFFALLAAVQYLMLTRWYGRRGGFIGAAVLICSSPMFLQWSISARGAYIEILLWGTLLLWSYMEWFAQPAGISRAGAMPNTVNGNHPLETAKQRARNLKQLLFGLLIGSGLWLNPAIVLFIVPIVVHALMNRPLAAGWDHPRFGPTLTQVSRLLGRATAPIAWFAAVLTLNAVWAVWVSDHRVHSEMLFGLLPRPFAAGLLVVVAGMIGYRIHKATDAWIHLRRIAASNAALFLGLVIGAAPAVLYTVRAAIGAAPMDPSLPLGFRPIWLTGETIVYLLNGMPLLFGADARPFLQLVGVGRDTVVHPLGIVESAVMTAANWLVVGSLVSTMVIVLSDHRAEIGRLLRLRADRYSPTLLLMLAVISAVGLYVLGGCTLDFTTIRYLVPLWAFLPGLVAAAFVSGSFRKATLIGPIGLCAAWFGGQAMMIGQIGAPHPLRPLADQLVGRGISTAVAEPLDAHLLSYLTRQKCRTIEFESFWPRLSQYHALLRPDQPADYLVQTSVVDRSWDWISGGWPGETPPETRRFLWPRLRRAMRDHPDQVLSRTPLCDGYELIRLATPLHDRTVFKGGYRPHVGERSEP